MIPIRFTGEERRFIKEKSELHQISFSECVRRLALNRRLPAKALPKIHLETYKELCQIGNNLNKLVRHFHSGKIPLVDQQFFELVLEKVKKVGLEVMRGAS